MVAVAKPLYITPQEYLDRERSAEFKSEYFAGAIYAMSGASEAHNLINGNLFGGLWPQFKGRPCKVYVSDMKVRVGTTGMYAYPDVVALCGEAHFDDRHKDILLNPALVFEVLSPSTEAYDRGVKFNQYQHLASLTDYILISQNRIRLERYQRQADGSWRYTSHEDAEEVIRFTDLECELRLADIYDKVTFPARIAENAQSDDSPAT
jgi:Uma2 family endonuclease